MSSYYFNIVLLLKRLLLVVLLFFVSRLFFYIYNIGIFADVEVAELFKIFILGLRFDLSVICYFNLLFIITHVIPIGKAFSNRAVQIVLKIYFVTVNGVLILVNLIDSIYFHFIQKRSTADIFKFIFVSDDVPTLLPGFAKDYWFVIAIWIVLIILTWMIYPKLRMNKSGINNISQKFRLKPFIYKLVTTILILVLSMIGARGGLQLKPLAIIDASKQVNASQMPLVLNSVFTIMTTYGHDVLTEKTYYSYDECNEIYPVTHNFNNQKGNFNNKNIVVLLLESFSKEYVGFLNDYNGYTPFLDSLANHSMVMENAFANGLRSIDAIPAIVIGIPALMDDPFITSIYNRNNTNSLPVLLKEKGYQTAFFHGGTNGTMNFDGFASYAGFDDYYGRFEYDNDGDYDGYWGIYDEPFLQYFAQKLNSFKEPFFAFEFTLSSHYPYSIPDNHKGEFPEGAMKIHKVVRYSDYALKQFFNTAKKMSWYNNTLFIIVADHPAQSVIPTNNDDVEESGDDLDNYLMSYYKNTSGRYAIPMMLFSPGDSLFKNSCSQTVQQTDLMPTILDYLNYDKPVVAFGSSILSDHSAGFAVQFVNGLYQITSGEYSLVFDGDKSISLFNNTEDPKQNNNLLNSEGAIAESMEKTIKAFLQQYLNRMINNELMVKSDS
ncbi:MAG: sulfatase-like hydrolase/transferase [Bacteroidetes bacterium]|nr:sulfatase-like hydrolase/transferase [Bacteroidota bacterium]